MTQFLNNFYTVFIQIIILFLLIGFGFVGNKTKLINTNGSKVLSDIVMYFVTPCLIINSFNIPFEKSALEGLLICAAAFLGIMVFSILVVHLIFRGKNEEKKRVLRFAVVFSNVGYMGIPLQEAILGETGVFYGSVCVGIFNIVLWTYGIICSSGSLRSMSVKKLIFNPGIIGVTLGLLVFFFTANLPEPIDKTLGFMAGLNTPLAMMVIGFNLASNNLLEPLKQPVTYLVSFLRLLAVPLVSLLVLVLIGVRGDILISLIVAASAPVAAVTTVFAVKFENDIKTSVNLVALTTILSSLTMPFVVALAQMFQ
ncbi:MAG: hypothetical protein E7540_03405 [Ruminococcaceae bacterium]|nr:hypothetical protein [Oscillospiraceae bacterium]